MEFFLAVQVADYVYTETEPRMATFKLLLSNTFEVDTFYPVSFAVMGSTITVQEDFYIVVSHAKALR